MWSRVLEVSESLNSVTCRCTGCRRKGAEAGDAKHSERRDGGRLALTAWSGYWRSLALDWLEAGWLLDTATSDALATAKDSPQFSQTTRHRAAVLWRSATEV